MSEDGARATDKRRFSLTGGSIDALLFHLQTRSPLRLLFDLGWLGLVALGAVASAAALTHLDALVEALRARPPAEQQEHLRAVASADAKINRLLARALPRTGAVRALAWRYHDGTEGIDRRHFYFASATHEAVAEGLFALAHRYQRVPFSFLAGSETILAGGCVRLDLEATDAGYRGFFGAGGARALAQCPLFSEAGIVIGFVGLTFDAPLAGESEPILAELRKISHQITGAMVDWP